MTEQEQRDFIMNEVWKVHRARTRAAQAQFELDHAPKREMAMIACVDNQRGFAKDGQIPWHYPQDFKWFQKHTKGNVCVMGRTTYEDIVERLGDKAKENALPGRKCLVVSSSLDQDKITNATVVPTPFNVEGVLDEQDVDKTVFFIGGERIFWQCIAIVDTVYLTVINKDYECDKFFPVEYLQQHFDMSQKFKHQDAPDLIFLVYRRKKNGGAPGYR